MLWTPERQELARTEAAAWGGTPHRHRLAVKGVGVDCIKFVLEIFVAAGICQPFKMPAYNPNDGILRETNVMADHITEHMHGEALPTSTPPEFGDVCIFECMNYSNHMGIIIDGAVWHCPGRGRVGPETWENVQPKLQSLLRVTATGWRDGMNPENLTAQLIARRTS